MITTDKATLEDNAGNVRCASAYIFNAYEALCRVKVENLGDYERKLYFTAAYHVSVARFGVGKLDEMLMKKGE